MGGSETVLLVEDQVLVRKAASRILSSHGYRVLDSGDPLEALKTLAMHPEIALLVTDVMMPKVNGYRLAVAAREERPDLRLLFVSGYSNQEGVMAALAKQPFLSKPITPERFLRHVRSVLDNAPLELEWTSSIWRASSPRESARQADAHQSAAVRPGRR